MRRKSERVKDKDKPTEKKSEKSPKKSRRSSRRRKKSSSSSPEESETDEYDTSFKSCKDDTEEEHSSSTSRNVHGKVRVSLTETNSDASALGAEVEEKEASQVVSGRTRRHSKKQSADEVEEKPTAIEHEGESKEEKGKEAESPTETPEKHKDSESKSSVWQVKSADCSGGEIKKLKLCIVRPPEPTEPSPRKRKKLSRTSHRDTESAGSAYELDDHDSQDERRKSRKSVRIFTEDLNIENSNVAEPAEKKTRAKVSSEDEQREDSHKRSPIKVSDEENEQDDKESSLDDSLANPPLESKEAAIDPFDELTKETKKQDKFNTLIDNSVLVDSKSATSSLKLPSSQEPSDNLQDKTVLTRSLEDQSVKCVTDRVDNKLPTSEAELPSKAVSPSSKEANALDLPEVNPIAEKALKENIKGHHLEETSAALDAPEEKTKVCIPSDNNLSTAVVADVNIPKLRNSSEDKSDDSPIHKSPQKKTKLPDPLEKDSSNIKSSSKVLKSRGSSPDRSKTRHSSDSSSRDGDSEEERRSRRKQHANQKRSVQLNRGSDSRRKARDSDEEISSISAPLKKSLESTDKSNDQQSLSIPTSKAKSASKDIKTKSIWEESSRPEGRKYKVTIHQGGAEVIGEKQQVREKISLKRSTSYAIYPTSNVAEGVETKGEINPGDSNNLDQSNTIDVNVLVASDSVPNLTRKRRWRASQTISTAGKKPTLSISSDSLKHLIPEAKTLAMSEVQLTDDEDEEEEEGEVLEKVRDPLEKEVDVILDKHRDEIPSSKLTEEMKFYQSPMVPDPPESNAGAVRKISLMSSDAARLQRSPSPARHRVSNVLFVTNLVRPFTVNQLKELLARTGKIQNNGFWIDKIKSKCYVQFGNETEAQETRHALHGVRWPVSNPKQLCVDYAKKEDMDLAQELSEGNHIPRKTEPLKIDRIDGWLTDQSRDKDREHNMRDEREREKLRPKEKNVLGPMDILEKSRAAKMTMNVREWDLGKMDLGQFDDREFHREERSRERERRMHKERGFRSSSRELPARKMRKKEEDAPAKLLDDLFKKTKVTPCVYWLPLTADQIVVKEEMRRKHMAEHERRMAEMRKAERERQRGRMQGRTSQRRFDEREREKRKHRSLSGSPKK